MTTVQPQLTGALESRLDHSFHLAAVLDARFLLLTGTELDATIEDELASNAALEAVRKQTCPGCGRAIRRGRCLRCGTRAGPQRTTEVDEWPAAEQGVRQRLLADLLAVSPAALRPTAGYLVECLDDRGLLNGVTLAEIAGHLGVPESEVAEVVRLLRTVGPAGIGAVDAVTGLLAQLDEAEGDAGVIALARRLVDEFLPMVAANDLQRVAAEAGTSRRKVADALDLLRGLRPYPGLGDGDAPTAGLAPPSPPDVIVTEDAGSFRVTVVEAERWALRVDRRFVQVARDQSAPQADVARREAARAQAFLGRLERRWQTLDGVARSAVEHHADHLSRRSLAFKPLTQASVAQRLGLDPSVVSRAVRDRVVQLPWGEIVPMQRLFGPGHDIRAALAELLQQAGPTCSDRQLRERLAAHGVFVARRTVAKYRAQLGHTRRCR